MPAVCYSFDGLTIALGGAKRLRDGSDVDFRRRAVECLDSLYAFAVSLCHDRAAAEDLVQETYLRALRAMRHPAPDENLRA